MEEELLLASHCHGLRERREQHGQRNDSSRLSGVSLVYLAIMITLSGSGGFRHCFITLDNIHDMTDVVNKQTYAKLWFAVASRQR